MALRMIDIASHQAGLNVASVDADGFIVKATQGWSYTNPYCVQWVEDALSLGKAVGVYHYIGGGNATKEIDFFINSIRNWIGKVVVCLDWEDFQNSAWRDESYLEVCIKRVIELTGMPPIVYASKDAPFPWSLCKKYNCGTWVAQYASRKTTGWQDSPWNEGAYSCAIRQYTANGRIAGWSGDLDLNKFYGDMNAWRAYCGGSTASQPSAPSVSGSTLELAIAVMEGKYGNGDARKSALGDRYQEVQDFINHIASASDAELAAEVKQGKYGNGNDRMKILGGRYDAVQAIVNGSSKSVDELAREVIAGKWGNDPERTQKLTAAGYDASAVQSRVNELL